MSENKDISSCASKSLLPEKVIEILNKSMSEGLKIGRLNLGYRNINDSMMPESCEWIVNLGDKVKILGLRVNQITSAGASMLFDTLKNNHSSIKEIDLYRNEEIDDKCMKSLGEYIKLNKSIEKISLSDTSISDAGIEILAPYLDGNTTFRILNLSGNKGIRDKSIPLLMKMIESSCIEYIGINYTSITQKKDLYVFSVCSIIKNGSMGLDLLLRDINDNDLIKICDAMKKYGIDKLNEINLTRNNVTSKGASLLIDTLKECNSVVSKLNVSGNQLDDECTKQLGEYLHDNEHVEILRLGDNKITDKGIEILSEHLIGNAILKVLLLFGNKGITDTSAPHLIEIVKKSCITKMDLNKTSISEEKKQEIIKALSIPIDQREVPIKSNTKSAAKISAST